MQRGGNEEKHLLGSGIPCVKHKCTKCCIETSMPLSRLDVERILKERCRFTDFAVKIGKEWRLKNSSGKCIFLSESACEVYSFRPEGCRLYPLVYDENSKRAVMDRECPFAHEFEFGEDEVDRLRMLLKRVKKEARREYRNLR